MKAFQEKIPLFLLHFVNRMLPFIRAVFTELELRLLACCILRLNRRPVIPFATFGAFHPNPFTFWSLGHFPKLR